MFATFFSPGVLDQLRQGQVHFDIQPLYPTFVGDVASLLLLLVEHLMDGELRGIYHWQGPDQLSELQIAKVWCQAHLKLGISFCSCLLCYKLSKDF